MPYQDVKPVKELIKQHKGKWESVVVVGMGGSAVCPMTLVQSLIHERWNELTVKARKNGPRIYAIDNLDPKSVTDLFDVLDPKKTSVSGREPLWQHRRDKRHFHLARSILEEKAGKDSVGKGGCRIHRPRQPSPPPWAVTLQYHRITRQFTGPHGLVSPHSLLLAGLCNLDVDAILDRCRRHG